MGGLEKEELVIMVQGMTEEEQQLIAETLPDETLLEELCRRYTDLLEEMKQIKQAIRK